MSETTPDTEKTESSARSSHLKAVDEQAATPEPAQSGPVRQGGGHMTGLLALLLAVAAFAFLAQFSANRTLQAENQQLATALEATQAELAASRAQMNEARDGLAGLRDMLVRIEGLLAPPAPAEAGAAEAPAEAAAPAEATAE
jgi:uncharacterized protein HemX